MRMVLEPVEGLVEVTGVAACADGDQREQPRIARGVLPRGGGSEAAHLRQGVVEDVRQPVAVGDQVLDGVEPAVAVRRRPVRAICVRAAASPSG
jgi:hypothetical protein